MEYTVKLNHPKQKLNKNTIDLSSAQHYAGRNLTKQKNIAKVHTVQGNTNMYFDTEDEELVNLNPDNPFEEVFGSDHKKKLKYKEQFPKDNSITDTNFDSTDTEPTDTQVASTSYSEYSFYKTTTDEFDKTESLDPNTEAHRIRGYSSPSFHPSEDDSDESTDTEYFDSDATTESTDKSYTSLSEDVDDSPDQEPSEEPPKDKFPPMDGGPPETFRWSSDEQMEIPEKNTKAKTFDPYEDLKKAAKEKFGPDFEANPDQLYKDERSKPQNSSVFRIFDSVVKHIAPKNYPGFESERMKENKHLAALDHRYRLKNKLAK